MGFYGDSLTEIAFIKRGLGLGFYHLTIALFLFVNHREQNLTKL